MSPRQTRAAARAQDAAATAERQLAATELRRMGLRVPNIKATPASSKQVAVTGWLLFGVDIEEQPQQPSHLVAGLTVPWFLDESLRVLVSHASTEGILRKSGSLARQRLLKTSLESSGSLHVAAVVLASAPVHDVSGLFKEWLQLLPERLLPGPLVQLLLSCHMKHGLEAVLLGLRLLPDARLSCLRHLLTGLSKLSEAPLSRMDARNLATVLAPTLCCLPPPTTNTREELDNLVSLVEALIRSAHLIGSALPPRPGREGRKKTNSACLLLNQLRRLVAQRRAPSGGEDDGGTPGSPPALGSKRTKPRELLPRGLSPWKRAKRGEDVPPSQQQQQQLATPEPPLDNNAHELGKRGAGEMSQERLAAPAVTITVSQVAAPPCVAVALEEAKESNGENPDSKPEPMLLRREGLRRGGGSCAGSFAGSSLRRGRPNSLRSGLPSPRNARPGAKRHSSTGSKPRPPKGKENLRSSFRDAASEVDSPFNAHAMAHIAALRARRNAVFSSSGAINQTVPDAMITGAPLSDLPEDGAEADMPQNPFEEGPHMERGLSAIVSKSCASVEQPATAEVVQEEDEAMDVVADDTQDLQTTPAQNFPPHDVFAFPAPPSSHRKKQEQADSFAMPPPAMWMDGQFALPSSPPGIGGGAGTKRESIIQIRERNAGMVRNNVEVFNRVAAAQQSTTKAPPQRVRRAASAQSKASGSSTATNRAPLRETNFQHPASPPPTAWRNPRDWEMEL